MSRLDLLAIALAVTALVGCRSSAFEPSPRPAGNDGSAGAASLVIVGPNVISTKGTYAWDAQVSGLSLSSCEIHWSLTYPPATVAVDLGVGVEQRLTVRAGDGDFQLNVGASCVPGLTGELLVRNQIGIGPS